MPSLENDLLKFAVEPGQASWSLSAQQEDGIRLEGARLRAKYRLGPARRQALHEWGAPRLTGQEGVLSPHGPLRQLQAAIAAGDGVSFTLTFALPQRSPLFLWKLAVENNTSDPAYIERLEMLRVGPQEGALVFSAAPYGLAFFANGWQSWSFSAVYGAGDRFRRTRLGPLRAPTDVNAGTPQSSRPGRFSSDMFAVLGDRTLRRGVLAGFLSQQQHFGSLEADLTSQHPRLSMWANGDGARLDPGKSMETDWACLAFVRIDDPDPLGAYIDAVARQNGVGRRTLAASPPVGWCSWYQYSSSSYVGTITPADLHSNLEVLQGLQKDMPLSIFQIDDGWQANVGDWGEFSAPFPQGVAPLAAEARQVGQIPGLWMSPFIVHPKSRLASQHPDWLLRGRWGRPANAGLFWNAFAAALDVTHPEALDYAAQAVRRAVHEWGFSYLKLDFLYAAAVPGRRFDPTRTRAQALYGAMQSLRQAAGEDAYLLGCSCPLGSAIGVVDAMRIGADTHWTWRPEIMGRDAFIQDEPNLPSARNACHNTLTRAALHRRWWVNDPDCLLLRKETQLNEVEVRTIATVIALTGGSLLLSDDLTRLPPERIRIAQSMLPLIGKAPLVLDWFDAATPSRLRLDLDGPAGQWHLLALFNWEDELQDATVNLREFGLDPARAYFVSDFWSRKLHRMTRGKLLRERIPAHGVLLYAARSFDPAQPQYLGSDLHISQGLEVMKWKATRRRLKLTLQRPGSVQGNIYLFLPRPVKQIVQDGSQIEIPTSKDGISFLFLSLKESVDLDIKLK
jgi:alpha-galactosidase